MIVKCCAMDCDDVFDHIPQVLNLLSGTVSTTVVAIDLTACVDPHFPVSLVISSVLTVKDNSGLTYAEYFVVFLMQREPDLN